MATDEFAAAQGRLNPVRELLIALALVRSGPRVAALLRERLGG